MRRCDYEAGDTGAISEQSDWQDGLLDVVLLDDEGDKKCSSYDQECED